MRQRGREIGRFALQIGLHPPNIGLIRRDQRLVRPLISQRQRRNQTQRGGILFGGFGQCRVVFLIFQPQKQFGRGGILQLQRLLFVVGEIATMIDQIVAEKGQIAAIERVEQQRFAVVGREIVAHCGVACAGCAIIRQAKQRIAAPLPDECHETTGGCEVCRREVWARK